MTTVTQHALKHVRLQLARSKAFPNGSASHGYDLVAPLDKNGHIDVELWRKHREACRVRRFWENEDDAVGHLVHKPGGAEHARWAFEYGPGADEDDEAGFGSAHVLAWRIRVDQGPWERASHLRGDIRRGGGEIAELRDMFSA